MAEHDPQAFEQLFESEPSEPSHAEVGEWMNLYTRLVALLERHLEETRSFAQGTPERLQEYLSRENVKILDEELQVFRQRLQHWTALA